MKKNYGIGIGLVFTVLAGGLLFGAWYFNHIYPEAKSSKGSDIQLFIMVIIWFALGLFMCISGIKAYITDRRTEKYGVMCIARVNDMNVHVSTGKDGSKQCYYIAKINLYLESMDVIIPFEEQFSEEEYKALGKGDFINALYYNDDINVKSRINDKESIPEDIRRRLGEEKKIVNEYEDQRIIIDDFDSEVTTDVYNLKDKADSPVTAQRWQQNANDDKNSKIRAAQIIVLGLAMVLFLIAFFRLLY